MLTRLGSESRVIASVPGHFVVLLCVTVPLVACAERPAPDAPAPISGLQQGPSADALRRLTADCKQVSRGLYKLHVNGEETVPVCGLEGAVFWTADLDVDCDGRESPRCNRHVDPDYQSETAAHDSAGQPLDAAAVPYVVVPAPSDRWSYKDSGLRVGHSVVAVIYGDRVAYGILGDVGPKALLGEASYAMAECLGMASNPRHGGVDKGVLYVAFTGKEGEAGRPDDAADIERLGRRLAARLAPAR